MSRGFVGHDQVSRGFPRVSGDEPWNMPGTPDSPPFSPRERG